MLRPDLEHGAEATRYWILGVFRDGKSLNTTDQPVSIPCRPARSPSTSTAATSGRFKLGQRFLVDATLAGGGT